MLRRAQLKTLTSKDVRHGSQFGRSVAIDGTTAVVGALLDDDNGLGSGSAYVFDVMTGTLLTKLLPNDGDERDFFGGAVGIHGHTVIIGAWGDNGTGTDTGAAYLFDIANGSQTAKLVASDEVGLEEFGRSVDVTDKTAIVGAPYDDDNGTWSGSAYLFDVVSGSQIAKLLASDASPEDQFGLSVGISGEIAIVGAPGGSGAAYLFDIATGSQFAKLTAADAAAGFGSSVDICGEIAIIGVPFDEENGTRSGSAYFFDITTGEQIAKLVPVDGAAGEFFGGSVSMSGKWAVIGAYRDDDNGNGAGAAYIYQVPESAAKFPLFVCSLIVCLWSRR